MNYNDVVNRFKTIVEDHRMLVDFGYGQISDIKTRSEGMGELEGADYPYLFLNPGVHNRDQSTITYNFNMIIMDMAREEEASTYQNFLNIQSNCIQYCDDVIARLYYHYKDKPEVSFNISYTPFYERFQDDLAGSTATISITVPNNINDCISPFTPIVPPIIDLPIFHRANQSQDQEVNFLRLDTNTETEPCKAIWNDQFFTAEVSGIYQFKFDMQMSFAEPSAGEIFPIIPLLYPDDNAPIESSGNWPTQWVNNDVITWTATYDVEVTAGTLQFFRLFPYNGATEDNSIVTVHAGSTMTIGTNVVCPVDPYPVFATQSQDQLLENSVYLVAETNITSEACKGIWEDTGFNSYPPGIYEFNWSVNIKFNDNEPFPPYSFPEIPIPIQAISAGSITPTYTLTNDSGNWPIGYINEDPITWTGTYLIDLTDPNYSGSIFFTIDDVPGYIVTPDLLPGSTLTIGTNINC
jgi:hypothetical protein